MLCLCALTIVSAALTFMQLGFIGIGKPGEYMAYAIGLLAPVAAGSLLLGTLLGTLHGLLSGGILYVHARLLPLDVFERYFTNPLSSIVLLGCAGLVMGVCFAFAFGIKSRVVRWTVTLVACLAVSALATYAFSLIVDVQLQGYWETFTEVVETEEGTHEETQTLSMRTLALYNSTFADRRVQAFTQFVLMSVVCVAVYAFVRFLYDTAQMRTMRTEFRLRTLSAMILTFLVVSSVGFVSITFGLSAGARKSMYDELIFLRQQMLEYIRYSDVLSTVELNDNQRLELDLNMEASTLVAGYDADSDYTILVFSQDDKILEFTNSPAYDLYMREDVVLGSKAMTNVRRLVETGEVAQIPWAGDFFSMAEERVSAQLAYVCAIDADEYTVVLVAPFTLVFAQRGETMLWVSLVALALLATLYIVVSRVLERLVAKPIDGMTESLKTITNGNLDEVVAEVNTVEFSMLSAFINTTVDSLKRLIHEAEQRTKVDLETARSIQESALPRMYPAFPGNDRVDLFALMDPAREVGGDFYDFFELDDHTVAFLIADVSGKGIPASLFMMAAKNEIENRMRSGLRLNEAVAAANAHLSANNDANMFVTAWTATFDWKSGLLTYVNAGHNYPLLRHEGSWEWMSKKCGPILGVFEGACFREETIQMVPGDEVLLYTDGVNEAYSASEDEYGNDRLKAFVGLHPETSAEDMVRALRADVAAWAEGVEQSDDVTVLVMEYR